jgi:hypothetical protein
MKKKLLLSIITCVAGICSIEAQSDSFWSKNQDSNTGKIITSKAVSRPSFPNKYDLYDVNINALRQTLFTTLDRSTSTTAVITLPNTEGKLEQFQMYEASNFEADLQAKFPEIRAYSGKGITDKYATVKLSISPEGIQTMVFRTDKENEFMEPYSQDAKTYAVYKSQREKGKLAWSCSTDDQKMVADVTLKTENTNRFNDGNLRTMRLAQSCTAEYANYFGATSAAQVNLVLAAFNNTLTRCNGVYEKDLGLHLNLISNVTSLIFYNSATDPYADSAAGLSDIAGCTSATNDCPGAWNTQLQSTITSVIGEANYDIGHLFGASGGGGNAGCIGCVCNALRTSASTPTYQRGKGEGITSPADNIPQGDNFDIDYVVHEIGHQLGGNHTFTHGREGTSTTQVEVGSGITIMGYAGITNNDVTAHSIDTYHARTIAQIQANLAGKTCPVTTPITANNATPVANAGADYTIPKSTPFILTGSATDANTTDALSYSWEQYNAITTTTQTGAGSNATATKAAGPNFISWAPTASPSRYFPKLATILANSTLTAQVGGDAGMNSEALPSVARTLNFRLTVRDNVPYSSVAPIKVGQTNFDDMILTVNATAGPFTVTSQSTTGISYTGGSSQTVTWNVASTAAAPVSTADVKISLSTDNGLNFDTVLLATTPNDGTQAVTIPNGVTSANCRVKVEAVGNVFFNVNTTKFAISPSLGYENFELTDLSLFPSPNNGNFTLKFTSESSNDIIVMVYDMSGRKIFEKNYANTGSFNQNISLNNAVKGIYLASIIDGPKRSVRPLIVE